MLGIHIIPSGVLVERICLVASSSPGATTCVCRGLPLLCFVICLSKALSDPQTPRECIPTAQFSYSHARTSGRQDENSRFRHGSCSEHGDCYGGYLVGHDWSCMGCYRLPHQGRTVLAAAGWAICVADIMGGSLIFFGVSDYRQGF